LRIFLIALVASIILVAFVFSQSSFLKSYDDSVGDVWVWAPAIGSPPYYRVERTLDSGDSWLLVGFADASVTRRINEVDHVIYSISSTQGEIYQVRVAGSLDNEEDSILGPWSNISAAWEVSLQPGTPQIITK